MIESRPGRAKFHTTQWGVVSQAADVTSPEAHQALSALCNAYWYPLYAYFRRRSSTAQEAEDLTQSFFEFLLETNLVAGVKRESGKFRTFLLTCCQNFLANWRQRERAQKRGGHIMFISIDWYQAERRYSVASAERYTPSALFDRQWALTVISRAIAELEIEYVAKNRKMLFDSLRPGLMKDRDAAAHEQIAKTLGTTADAIKKKAQRARKRFEIILRELIAETVSSPDQIDEEIRDLFAALSVA